MNASIVLTVICDDRPGIVEMLSKTLAEHEGNWVESSMLSLAGKFAGILQASVPESQVDALLAQFSAMQSSGLQIIAERSSVEATEQDATEVSLELVGQDRPGIVRDITRILAKHGVNVVELDTECQSASMSGEMLFVASARLIIPAETSVESLQEDLEKLANELMVDITLE